MQILYKDFRIKTHDPYGFVVQRYKPNCRQWKEPAYFRELEQAAKHLFEEQLRIQYDDVVLDLADSKAAQLLDGLVMELQSMADQISEACNAKIA